MLFNVVGGGFIVKASLEPIILVTYAQACLLFAAFVMVTVGVDGERLNSSKFYSMAFNRAAFVGAALLVWVVVFCFE